MHNSFGFSDPSAFGTQSYDNLQWILAAEVNVHHYQGYQTEEISS